MAMVTGQCPCLIQRSYGSPPPLHDLQTLSLLQNMRTQQRLLKLFALCPFLTFLSQFPCNITKRIFHIFPKSSGMDSQRKSRRTRKKKIKSLSLLFHIIPIWSFLSRTFSKSTSTFSQLVHSLVPCPISNPKPNPNPNPNPDTL